jgi:hypothetical protein
MCNVACNECNNSLANIFSGKKQTCRDVEEMTLQAGVRKAVLRICLYWQGRGEERSLLRWWLIGVEGEAPDWDCDAAAAASIVVPSTSHFLRVYKIWKWEQYLVSKIIIQKRKRTGIPCKALFQLRYIFDACNTTPSSAINDIIWISVKKDNMKKNVSSAQSCFDLYPSKHGEVKASADLSTRRCRQSTKDQRICPGWKKICEDQQHWGEQQLMLQQQRRAQHVGDIGKCRCCLLHHRHRCRN